MAENLYVLQPQKGLSFFGKITSIGPGNVIYISLLQGFDDTFFVGWNVWTVKKSDETTTPPFGLSTTVTTYNGLTAQFGYAAYTGVPAIDDQVYLVHPSISAVLIGVLAALTVPGADSVDNVYERDVTGNKTDTAITTNDDVSSIIRYLKGLMSVKDVPGADAITNAFIRDVIGSKTDTSNIVIGNTSSLMRYVKGILNQTISIVSSLADLPVLTETGGTLTADGTEQNVIIVNAPAAVFKPLKVKINLNNMIATDTIVIRLYERLSAAGALELSDVPVTFTGVDGGLLDGQTQITIDLDPNRYGFKVTLEQTAHVAYKDFVYEYFYED
jgi:hypothetical protein